jgi:hypothetical protein
VLDFSSEAAEDKFDDWSARQILGPPKITEYGDSGYAWAPLDTNGGHEWIVLKFRRRVYIREVLILESLNPGAVYKVEAKKENLWDVIWETTPKALPTELHICSAIPEKPLKYPSDSVRIHLNTLNIGEGEWNEIAAVQLAGLPVEGDPIPPDDNASVGPRVTVKLAKSPPPPPPIPSNSMKVPPPNTRIFKPVPDAPAVGSPAFLEWIKDARGVLKATQGGEHKAQKPKEKQDDDIVTALAKRFEAIRGIGMDDPESLADWNDDWDDGSGATAAEWEDDDDILRFQ